MKRILPLLLVGLVLVACSPSGVPALTPLPVALVGGTATSRATTVAPTATVCRPGRDHHAGRSRHQHPDHAADDTAHQDADRTADDTAHQHANRTAHHPTHQSSTEHAFTHAYDGSARRLAGTTRRRCRPHGANWPTCWPRNRPQPRHPGALPHGAVLCPRRCPGRSAGHAHGTADRSIGDRPLPGSHDLVLGEVL